MSLLDENDELEQNRVGDVLVPDSVSQASTSTAETSSQAAESEDEWNW